MTKIEEALFNARLHVSTGTLLSDEAVREVCRALLDLEALRKRDDALRKLLKVDP